jgi:hypothetical protein
MYLHSISSRVCHMAKKYFSHSSLVIYFFPTPLMKLELQIGPGILIPNHVGKPDSTIGQQEILSTSQIIFITLFCACAQCFCCAFDQSQQTVELCWATTIFLSQTHLFWLFFIQFFCAWSHILATTAGEALQCFLNEGWR